MHKHLFLARPTAFSTYYDEVVKEYLDSPIKGSYLDVISLYDEIQPNLTYGEILKSLKPCKEKSFFQEDELFVCNEKGQVLFRGIPLARRKLF